jgi:hypothetical protein
MKKYFILLYFVIASNLLAITTVDMYVGLTTEKYNPSNPSFVCIPVQVSFNHSVDDFKYIDKFVLLPKLDLSNIEVINWPQVNDTESEFSFKADIKQLISTIESSNFEADQELNKTNYLNENYQFSFGKFTKALVKYGHTKQSYSYATLDKIIFEFGSAQNILEFQTKKLCEIEPQFEIKDQIKNDSIPDDQIKNVPKLENLPDDEKKAGSENKEESNN